MQVTRQKIVNYLRQHRQATVDELTKEIGLTHMAVRHHLNILQDEGLIEISATRRTNKPGRPVQIYMLTNEAKKLYPQDYLQLSSLLLEEIICQVGQEGMFDVFSNIAERMLEIAPEIQNCNTFEERLEQAVRFLSGKGFAVQWSVENGQYVIHHMACPYRQLAARHQEICLLDKILIGILLDVSPERTCCIAEHDDQCTYCLGIPSESSSAEIASKIELAEHF